MMNLHFKRFASAKYMKCPRCGSKMRKIPVSAYHHYTKFKCVCDLVVTFP